MSMNCIYNQGDRYNCYCWTEKFDLTVWLHFIVFTNCMKYQVKDNDAVLYPWNHWGLVMNICNSDIGEGHGVSHVQHQAITWANADMLLTEPLRTNFREIWIII